MSIFSLDYIANSCNNSNHSTIQIKPADAKSSTYIDFKVGKRMKFPNSKLESM